MHNANLMKGKWEKLFLHERTIPYFLSLENYFKVG